MNKMFFILFIIAFSAACSYSQDLNQVVLRADNDLATFKDTVSPIESMSTVLKARISKLLRSRCADLSEACDTDTLYFQTFKIDAGNDNFIYAVELDENLHGFQIYLCFHNAASNSYSEFYNIDGAFMYNNEEGFESWNGRMIDKPYIAFADLDGDGKKEILFQRRAHNGTWNAVETIAIRTDSRDNLKKYFSFYSKEYMFADPQVLAIRKIKSVGRTSVVLSVEYLNPATGKITRKSDLVRIEK